MSENPEHPDSAKSPAVGPSPTGHTTRITAQDPRDADVAAGAGAVHGRAGSHRAPGPGTSAAKIKLDAGAAGEDHEPMRPASRLPRLPSDEELAADPGDAGSGSDDGDDTPAPAEPVVHTEASPTTMLQMRPPAEEVARRQAAREKAANTKPVLTRVFQVMIAAFYPIVMLVLSIRLVTTSVFLWVEYHRPGFPADSFGFSTEDRLSYGSYTVDYLLNFAPPRYLGDLVRPNGDPLFLAREVGHMADVKGVIVMAFLLGLVLAILMVIGMMYLARKSFGGIRRALFAGSIATLALIVALGIFAVTGWEQFFTEFHKIFFAEGTWTFYTDDTLIRLFPSQFWMDSGIFIGAFVLIVSSLTLAFTWPTKDRRQAAAQRPGRRTA